MNLQTAKGFSSINTFFYATTFRREVFVPEYTPNPFNQYPAAIWKLHADFTRYCESYFSGKVVLVLGKTNIDTKLSSRPNIVTWDFQFAEELVVVGINITSNEVLRIYLFDFSPESILQTYDTRIATECDTILNLAAISAGVFDDLTTNFDGSLYQRQVSILSARPGLQSMNSTSSFYGMFRI
jgi:hypothetical protein